MTCPMYQVRPVGRVESPLADRESAPRQGDEGTPEAWIVFADEVRDAVADLEVGSDVIVLTWLDRADRDVLTTRPRGDVGRPMTGVFSTRSPDRPNPIGLHRVRIVAGSGNGGDDGTTDPPALKPRHFVRVAEADSGQPLHRFFHTWLFAPRRPAPTAVSGLPSRVAALD